jgi:hypothetical protein
MPGFYFYLSARYTQGRYFKNIKGKIPGNKPQVFPRQALDDLNSFRRAIVVAWKDYREFEHKK